MLMSMREPASSSGIVERKMMEMSVPSKRVPSSSGARKAPQLDGQGEFGPSDMIRASSSGGVMPKASA